MRPKAGTQNQTEVVAVDVLIKDLANLVQNALKCTAPHWPVSLRIGA